MKLIPSLLTGMLCLSGWALQSQAALIEQGRSDYQIVVSPDAIEAEVTAAHELQSYLSQITGVELPIVSEKTSAPAILVGQSPTVAQSLGGIDFTTLQSDEIILKTVGQDLVLSGERPRGSLYAVYELLETQWGVRFWSLDATDVPQAQTLELPQIDTRYAPTLFYREGYYDVLQNNPQFAVKARINGHCINIPEAWGGHLTLHGFCHTFDQYLPTRVHFKDHPDWYAWRNEQRLDRYAQLCLTNEEVRKALLEVVLNRLRQNPGTRIIDLSQNDNQLFCQCEKCNAFVEEHGNQSDLLIDVVNFVAEGIEKEFPNAMVETLAYQYTRSAPKTVFPRKNVMIRLCSIECDFGRPLDSETNQTFADDVRAWYKVAPLLFVWNYVTNFTKYYLPQPNWENLAGDIRFLLAHSVRGLFEQGSSGPLKVADLPELRAYLLSKLMWNPQRDENEIISEFLNGFYGPAAVEILQYLEIMKKSIAAHPEFKLICYQTQTSGWLSEENLAAAWRVMERAKAKVADNPKFKSRVEFAALPITFALLERPQMFKRKDFSSIDPIALAEAALLSTRAAGTRIFSEPGESEKSIRFRILRQYGSMPQEGEKPSIVGERTWGSIAGVNCFLCGNGNFVHISDDPAAIDGKSAQMPSNTSEWAVQLREPPVGKYEIYVEIRCDHSVEGAAFTAGTYNMETKAHKNMEGKAADIAGSDYHLVKVLDADLDSDTYIYVAPVLNPEIGNVWVNRLILIKAE